MKINQQADLKCPRCIIVMKKLIKHDVVLDICKKCHGMWLDDGEIDKLVRLSKHGK